MTLLEQCQIWNDHDEYKRIIEAIEAVSAGDRTPELDSELARAYNMSLPRFEKNFRERTLEAWEAFEKAEAGLRSMMDREDRDSVAGELIGKCSEILRIAFEDVSFELGYNGENMN